MDLNSLSLLVEILDAGNLSAAARRLKMSRANVSYHLNQFERSIGLQLVRRTTRRVEPTEVGLRLYQHGRSIQNELLAVLDVMFENRVEDLIRDEVDIAVRVMSEPPQNLVARDMGTVRYVACASPAYAAAQGMPTKLDELRTSPLITSAVIGRQLRVAAYMGEERHEVLLEPTLISENFLFLRQAILAGVGVGLVPDYVVKEDIRRGDVVTTLDDWRLSIFGTRMFLLYMPNRHHTRAMSIFIEFTLEQARQEGRRAAAS